MRLVFRLLLDLIIFVILVVVIYAYFGHEPGLSLINNYIPGIYNALDSLGINSTQSLNLSYPSIIEPPRNYIPQNQVIAYTLSLINSNRNTFGIANVTYSNESSAQQHSESMLQNGYFSHWDIYGMKPYMRYTLLGGNQSIQENVAYIYDSAGVNVTQAISRMENNMVYNDSECCNNGHRYNILNPQHNEVSIGVAYNRTTVYLTEDFISNYVTWQYGTPSYNDGVVSLEGSAPPGYTLSSIDIDYDPQVQNMTVSQLDSTSDYSYGQGIAGVGYSKGLTRYYFPNITTVYASTYITQKNEFDVAFNIDNLTSGYGAGEYTVLVLLTNSSSPAQNMCFTASGGATVCNQFVAASYTIFINGTGQRYVPQNI